MSEQKAEIGMIGLGVMGRNLLLNINDHGHSAAGFDMDGDKVKQLEKEGKGKEIYAVDSADKLMATLKKPRTVILLVPAGEPVDSVIKELLPSLEEDDLVVDGGNSNFKDTNRRTEMMESKKLSFIGVGISGGEKGARYGPSMMPGGTEKAYRRVQNIFEQVAAHVDDDPCVTYLGPKSAGHYVKMVHNGIEYAIIQLIAETYDLMKRSLGLTNNELGDVYTRWNEQELSSYLVEITGKIFMRQDDESDKRLIDMIRDQAKQKGTGKWTSQDAMDLQVPVPTIDAAVAARDMSGYKSERVTASDVLHGPSIKFTGDTDRFIDNIRNALFFSMITAYAQGMSLLRAASAKYEYGLSMKDIARIWRGGCIIRAALLEEMRSVFSDKPDLANLMLSEHFSKELHARQDDTRQVIAHAVQLGVPVPALTASLAYFDSYRSAWLPANLIQAQRDFFGSHTYERIDKDGIFHTQWEEK